MNSSPPQQQQQQQQPSDSHFEVRYRIRKPRTKLVDKHVDETTDNLSSDIEASTGDKSDKKTSCTNSTTTSSSDAGRKKLLHDVAWSDLADSTRARLVEHFDARIKSALDDLISVATSKENYLQLSGWKHDWMVDKRIVTDTQTVKSLPVKEYRRRDSLLTSLFQISHIRTVYHIFIAIMIVFCVNTVIHDTIDPKTSESTHHFDILHFAFRQIGDVASCWITMMLCTTFIPFLGFQIWVSQHSIGKGLIQKLDWVAIVCYIVYQVAFFILPVLYVIKWDLPPASSTIVVAEQVRMLMKSHAFVRSSVGMVLDYENNKAKSITSETSTLIKTDHDHETLYSNFSYYLYFLFAPTLVYKESYPQTEMVRWSYVATSFLEVLACFIFAYYIFIRFCYSQFATFGQSYHFTLRQLILASTACTLPGGLVMMVAFYAFLHAWHNAWAEMLRFGDRLFYKDWWNSTTFSVWYRTWNVIVHDWLYTYIYRDIQLLTGLRYRAAATATVFWISAAVHEYIIMVALRFCLPILFIFFAVGGLGLFFVQGSNKCWNVLLWITLFTGWGQMMCIYSMEWYARRNCGSFSNSWANFFIPHIILCNRINETVALN